MKSETSLPLRIYTDLTDRKARAILEDTLSSFSIAVATDGVYNSVLTKADIDTGSHDTNDELPHGAPK